MATFWQRCAPKSVAAAGRVGERTRWAAKGGAADIGDYAGADVGVVVGAAVGVDIKTDVGVDVLMSGAGMALLSGTMLLLMFGAASPRLASRQRLASLRSPRGCASPPRVESPPPTFQHKPKLWRGAAWHGADKCHRRRGLTLLASGLVPSRSICMSAHRESIIVLAFGCPLAPSLANCFMADIISSGAVNIG